MRGDGDWQEGPGRRCQACSVIAINCLLGNLGNGGLLGHLTAPATDAAASSGTNIMEDMAMNVSERKYIYFALNLPQMAQQQIEQMLSSGQKEEMAMEFLSSGQMEQMVQDFIVSCPTRLII